MLCYGCSVFCSNFAPIFLPSFSWLTDQGRQKGIPEKLQEIAQRVMARRRVKMSQASKELFLNIYELAGELESAADEADRVLV